MFLGSVIGKLTDAKNKVHQKIVGMIHYEMNNLLFGFIHRVVNKLIDELKGKANVAGVDLDDVIDEARDTFHKSVDVLQHGVSNILDVLNAIMAKKSRSLALTVSFIATKDCMKARLEDAQKVVATTPELMLLLQAAKYNISNEALIETCETVSVSFEYVDYFFKNCVQSEDTIFKDMGDMLLQSREIIYSVCENGEYRSMMTEGSKCAVKEKHECFQKYDHEVQHYLFDETQKKRRRESGNGLQEVCCTVQNVGHCTKTVSETSSCEAAKNFDQQLESNITRIADKFCDKHKGKECTTKQVSSDGFGGKAPAKEIRTVSGAATIHSLVISYTLAIAFLHAA